MAVPARRLDQADQAIAQLKNKFIYDLLKRPGRPEPEVLREGQILGMDLTRPRAVILIDAAEHILAREASGRLPNGPAAASRDLLRARVVINSVVRFFHLPDETICAYIGGGEVAVLKASTSRDLAAWTESERGPEGFDPSWANLAALKRAAASLAARLRRDTNAAISLGIGRYHPGIPGLARSYGDARAALTLGRRLQGHNQAYCLDDLGVAAFVGLSDQQTKVELARHLLSPLDQEPDLLETLASFFEEDRCPSSTAHRLAIHRNTLGYRLDKIASLTGLDARRFDDAVQIRLALIIRSLHGDTGRLGSCPIDEPSRPPNVGQMPGVNGRASRSA